MATHWSEAYIGLPYIAGEQDCVDLLARVQREVFRRQVTVPSARSANPFTRSMLIAQGRDTLANPVVSPAEGDAVLMQIMGLWHVGVWFERGEPWVLHALKSAGQVVAHRLRDLPRWGIKIEGFYRMRGDD
jgi:hypothetical protein